MATSIERREERIRQLEARLQDEKRKQRAAMRKQRNSGIFALGICFEQALMHDTPNRGYLEALVKRFLTGKTLDRAQAYLDALLLEEPAAPAPQVRDKQI